MSSQQSYLLYLIIVILSSLPYFSHFIFATLSYTSYLFYLILVILPKLPYFSSFIFAILSYSSYRCYLILLILSPLPYFSHFIFVTLSYSSYLHFLILVLFSESPYFSCFVFVALSQQLSYLCCLTSVAVLPFFPYLSHCFIEGNLYTHMRTHTGMVYRCTLCDFTTVNRGHLTEHEQTHSNVRHKCDLCQRDYNTIKSLVNHIRKYHNTSEGTKYLSQFQASTYRSICFSNSMKWCSIFQPSQLVRS